MNCEQVEELLSAYLDNKLAPEERRVVAAHLEGCSHCSAVLADFRRHDFLLSQLPRVSPSPALRNRIFSSPEYQELTGTSGTRNTETNPYKPPHVEPTGRPHLIALPGGRSSQGGLLSRSAMPAPDHQPTRKQPVLRPRRKGSPVLRAMYVAIAVTILLTIGVVGYISLHLMQPAGQANGGIIPPPASLPQGPLAAGMHLVFLRDGKLMSIPADGSTGAIALTPANVTVASNWAINAPLPGRSAGDMLAYIDLQTATIHTIRSDGLSDKLIPQRLLKAGIQPSSIWDTDTGADILSSLAWSPASNNSMLAFVADPNGTGLTRLYLYSTGTGSVQMVSLPLTGSVSHPVWSPDGIRIAFAFTHNGSTSIMDYNVQNHGLLTIANGSQGQAGDSVLSFDWSPDIDTPAITWSMGVPGHVHSIWTRRVGVSSDVAPRLLAQGDYTEALYSRDGHGSVGSWLLVGSPNGRTAELWRADVEGVSPVQLPSGQQISYAQWSPDGMEAYYLDKVSSGLGTLHVVHLATGEDTQVATGVATEPTPVWSYDSQELAYSTAIQLMVVNVQAGQKPLALKLHGPVSAFIWSATSAHQLVVALGDGQEGIFLVDTQRNTAAQVDKKGVTGPITWSEVP
ncbi:MAG TPA: zf-HC2 domain-containing protein [Ktedonobacteraceae bacterium]|nr:zf-HC2 domain-containing protein [Ktedonobacteraceae bacterium]